MSEAINLTGIQSLKIPSPVFDEFFKYDENFFSRATHPEGDRVEVQVTWDKDNKFQEHEYALAVKLDNCLIGYIPALRTIEGYINGIWAQRGTALAKGDKAEADRLFKKWERQNERYKYSESIRGSIETDLFWNDIPYVKGWVQNVMLDDAGIVLSVSIAIDVD